MMPPGRAMRDSALQWAKLCSGAWKRGQDIDVSACSPYVQTIPTQKWQIADTVKPVYNDHLMGYFSAFWSSSRWSGAT